MLYALSISTFCLSAYENLWYVYANGNIVVIIKSKANISTTNRQQQNKQAFDKRTTRTNNIISIEEIAENPNLNLWDKIQNILFQI